MLIKNINTVNLERSSLAPLRQKNNKVSFQYHFTDKLSRKAYNESSNNVKALIHWIGTECDKFAASFLKPTKNLLSLENTDTKLNIINGKNYSYAKGIAYEINPAGKVVKIFKKQRFKTPQKTDELNSIVVKKHQIIDGSSTTSEIKLSIY